MDRTQEYDRERQGLLILLKYPELLTEDERSRKIQISSMISGTFAFILLFTCPATTLSLYRLYQDPEKNSYLKRRLFFLTLASVTTIAVSSQFSKYHYNKWTHKYLSDLSDEELENFD